ncbi:MAG: three-Cys-motif partner protein TcmP [Pseudonocardiaceae bacterium]
MNLLWELEPATAAKHRLYKRYMDAWWPILLQPSRSGYRRPRVTYVDAFAGPGVYLGGEEGSPVFVLDRLLHHTAVSRMQLSRQRVRLVFVEKRRDRHNYLLSELTRRFGPLDELPVSVVVRRGEAGAVTGLVLDELAAWGQPILGIFDSWGNVNVPLTLVQRIAHNPASEVITTFGPNWFSRRETLDTEQLDAVFGGRDRWEPADRESRPEERWRAWLSTYRDALLRAGFRYRLQFQVVPGTGQPLYLVYGTGHEKGVEVMKEAMWDVDGTDGMSFRDPRTRGAVDPNQPTLWGATGAADPELIELVSQRLQEGATSLDELGKWLLLETARWRTRDAKTAVRDLLDDGKVRVEPSGRLTKASRIKLR